MKQRGGIKIYQIAICDDEPLALQEIKRLTMEISDEMGAPFCISEFNGVELLYEALCSKAESIHLILLDILMDGNAKGLALAQELRKMGKQTAIVLISASSDFILRGYDVQAVKYLLKPIDKNELRKAILFAYHTCYEGRYFALQQGALVQRVPCMKIMYLEGTARKSILYLEQDTLECCRRLSEVENELPDSLFCRCHKSFILNLNNVLQLKRYAATMKDGRSVPISKFYFKRVREAFLHHLETNVADANIITETYRKVNRADNHADF